MNFPNFLLVFSSLLGRNGENDTTNIVTKIHQGTEKMEMNPITYESSMPHHTATLPSKEIFLNQASSCHEVSTNSVSDPGEDLRTRNCMCDENCSMYKDCCEDSIHHEEFPDSHSEFTCVSTPFDGNIYIVNKCPSGYSELETVFKCETSVDSGAVHDISLVLRVTSWTSNITYANSFCAVCNNETRFDIWDPVLYYKMTKTADQEISNDASDLVGDIYSEMANREMILSHLDAENDSRLISQFDDSTYECSLYANMPARVRSTVRYCRSDVSQRERFSDQNVIKLDRYNLPPNLINPKKELDFYQKFRSEMNNRIRTCVYSVAHTGDPCLMNNFLSKHDDEVIFTENDGIFLKKYDITFDKTEYTNKTAIKNTIYVCGTKLPDKNEILTVVKVLLSRLSTCSIIFLLVINCDRKKLQSLTDKMTYAYCITMLLVYWAFEMHRHPRWCLFTEEAMNYFFLSHFVWFLAMSYELWNVICRLSVKFQSLSGKSHLRRFVTYCLLCWIVPLPVIPLTMYYRKFVNIPNHCPTIAGFQIRRPCLSVPESPIGLYVFFINCVIICINISLFIHVCYHIYLSKRGNVKSTSHNNYFQLFVKLALTMDMQWFFYLFSFSGVEALKKVNTLLSASHGLITVLAYGVKKSTFVDLYEKYKSYFDVVQKVRNIFALLFGGVKRAPFLKRLSVEPSTQHTGVDLDLPSDV